MTARRFVLALVAAVAVFTAGMAERAFGQDLPPMSPINFDAGTSIADGMLKRTGFKRFSIDGQKFSFKDANKYIADAQTKAMLMLGISRERIAIAFGTFGAASLCGGITIAIIDLGGHPQEEWSGVTTMIAGIPLIITGVALGFAALGIGISGYKIVKKAIYRYNSFGNFSEMRLEFAPTRGGMGLQLTF